MKVFKLSEKHLAVMGFTPNQQINNRPEWNFRQIIGVVTYAFYIILYGVYIIFEANSLDEYMDSIFLLNAIVAVMICFINIIFKNDKLFEMIEQFGNEFTVSTYSFDRFVIVDCPFHLIK